MSPVLSPLPAQQEAATCDEHAMHQSLLFSDGLKTLRNLRSRLYSAAEVLELSYAEDNQRQTVMTTLKDYAVEAFVNTVDHLGTMSDKVNNLVNENVDEVSGTEFRVSCIEQRLRTCQEYIDQEGRSQQHFSITAPKYHKHYILPIRENMPESGKQAIPKHDNDSQQFRTVIRTTIGDTPPTFRNLHSPSPLLQRARSLSPAQKAHPPSPSPLHGKLSSKERRAVSPLPTSSSLSRTGSLCSRPAALNSPKIARQDTLESQNTAPTPLHSRRYDHKESGRSSSRGKGFLRALLTRRRSKNDESLYSYLDEY